MVLKRYANLVSPSLVQETKVNRPMEGALLRGRHLGSANRVPIYNDFGQIAKKNGSVGAQDDLLENNWVKYTDFKVYVGQMHQKVWAI